MYISTKFTYNEYIGPYFFIARCSMIFASELPEHTIPWGTVPSYSTAFQSRPNSLVAELQLSIYAISNAI